MNFITVFSQTQVYTQGKFTYETVVGDPLNARIYKLENGLTVYLTVYKNEPRIQTYIAVRTGSKKDPHDKTGLAHYLEHMLFKGTDKFGSKDWSKEKPLIDEIIRLYEVYSSPKNKKNSKEIYHKIDSVSQIASQFAIANEYDKMCSSIGAKGTNAFTWVEQTVYVNDIPSNQLEKWVTMEAERFRNPVMRLFHTELEAVYEEKNGGLDNDGSKFWEALFGGLFQKHQYGTQTTIGTIEHLKNPSLKKVNEYLHTYYVPNNIAICLSGDFNPDEAIKIIDDKWNSLQPKDVPKYNPPVEPPITSPIVKNVYGQESEYMGLAFRFGGNKTHDAVVLTILDNLLYNGTTGLFDLNLNQKQIVLSSSSDLTTMNDYSVHSLFAEPRQGQKLEELTTLLLSEIDKIKKGDFPDWQLEAIINNIKLERIESYESNRSRASSMFDAFISEMSWEEYINDINRLSKITKQEIVDFANENYSNNYVVVYKRTGEDKNVVKVDKPKITPVQVNRNDQSDFLKSIITMPVNDVQPVFVDYEKDILQGSLKSGLPVLYKENTENNLFNLYYVLDMGLNNDKRLGLALGYFDYLGTSKYSPEQINQEFFKLGCSYSVSSSDDQVYVTLTGLNDNFENALALFEELLADIQPNEQALLNLEKDILKVREDNKLSQDKILWDAMRSYAQYGSKSPYTNIISESEFKSITSDELISLIKSLTSYKHSVLYYGPKSLDDVSNILNDKHKVPAELKSYLPAMEFKQLETSENKVYFVHYDGMVQSEIIFLSKGETYNKEKVPMISIYNEYFGSGMSGIVFQEMRESKALAYGVFSSFGIPRRKDLAHYNSAYIGTQADKLPEAMEGMMNLLNNMPESELTFNAAKKSVINQIQTSRTTKTSVLFSYLNSKKMGLDHDISKDIYEKLPTFTMSDVKNFAETNVKGRTYTILVLGDRTKVDMKTLEKYGKLQELSLQEIFGY